MALIKIWRTRKPEKGDLKQGRAAIGNRSPGFSG
jgi:hypothetical protein